MLALVAGHPDATWTATTVGRAKKDGVAIGTLNGVLPDDARAELDSLVALYRRGRREPLPLAPKSSCEYATRRRGSTPIVASQQRAAAEWRKNLAGRDIGEFDDQSHRRVWGDATFAVLLAQPPDPGETDWPDEPHRFGQLARRVWDPLLSVEEVTEA